jgi:hypothetical protein
MVLYLIGTSHLDLKGPERLEKILGFVRPDIILAEGKEEIARKRIAEHAQLDGNSSVIRSSLASMYGDRADRILQFFSMMHYEAWVSHQYQDSNPGTQLFFYDPFRTDDLKAAQKHGLGNMVDDAGNAAESFEEWVANLDFEDHQRRTEEGYTNPSVQWLKENSPVPFERLNIERDEKAERRIRELIGSAHQMVYIGGVAHIFGDYHPNLFDRLADLNPTRVKLSEVDKF